MVTIFSTKSEETMKHSSSPLSDPLFSCFVTLWLITALYSPQFFLRIVISPAFISALALSMTILRLVVEPESKTQFPDPEEEKSHPIYFVPDPIQASWLSDGNCGSPLEIVYEDDEYDGSRFPSSDSDFCSSSSDGKYSESEDGEGDGFIEIVLEKGEREWVSEDEEENLIEIDVSPATNGGFAGNWDGDSGGRKIKSTAIG